MPKSIIVPLLPKRVLDVAAVVGLPDDLSGVVDAVSATPISPAKVGHCAVAVQTRWALLLVSAHPTACHVSLTL